MIKLSEIKTDWLLYSSAILTWTLVSYIYLKQVTDVTRFISASFLLVAFIFIFIKLTCEPNKNKAVSMRLIWAMVLMVGLLMGVHTNSVAPILLVLIATQFAGRVERSQAILMLIVINLGYYLLETFVLERSMFFTVLTFFLLQVFAYSTIEISLNEKKAKAELAALNQELIATRFLLKESSKRQERIRISRDLHDVVGHQLTALSLNLEVSCHKVPDEYKPMLEQNLSLAKKLLADIRRVVKEMRAEEQFDLVAALNELFEQLPNCRLSFKSQPEVKSLSLKQQLVYCLQEGISNGLRHGGADEFELDFQHHNGGKVTIKLTDNGIGFEELNRGSGLTGMTERLSSFNGEVSLTSSDSGSELTLLVEDNYD